MFAEDLAVQARPFEPSAATRRSQSLMFVWLLAASAVQRLAYHFGVPH